QPECLRKISYVIQYLLPAWVRGVVLRHRKVNVPAELLTRDEVTGFIHGGAGVIDVPDTADVTISFKNFDVDSLVQQTSCREQTEGAGSDHEISGGQRRGCVHECLLARGCGTTLRRQKIPM